MTQLLQALFIARGLIAGPSTWTTGASARNAGFAPVSSMSTEAVCFCAIGAVRRGCTVDLDRGRVDYATEQEIGRLLDAEVVRQYGAMPHPIDGGDTGLIIGINDYLGRRATLAVFDAVIARVRRSELIEGLIQARALIADPASWTQQVLAKTVDGIRTAPQNADACRFCAGGALIRTGHGNQPLIDDMSDALERTSTRLHPEIPPGYSATVWVNDRFGHAPVLRIFDEAIASLRIASLRG